MATIAFVTEEGAAHQAPYREAINSIAGIDRALLMDPGGTTLEESRRACGAKVQAAETSVEALLRHGAPDLAIVSMIGAHAPAVIEPLLEAGVHVMAEKPSCMHPDQFERLVEVAERRGVHLMMAFAQRRDPVKVDARRIIAEGGIGSLYAVQASQVSDQARIPGKVATNDWTFRKALAGGGHLTWLGIHALDLIRYLTGAEIEAVQAMAPVVGGQPIDVEDLALVNFRFAGGAHGSLFSGYLMEQKQGHATITVYGDAGWLRINVAEQGRLEWTATGQPTRVVSYAGRAGGYTPWVKCALAACLDKTEPPVTARDGLAALRIIHAAYRSAAEGRTVDVDGTT